MSLAMRSRGRPDAAATIVDDLVAWLGGETATPARDSARHGATEASSVDDDDDDPDVDPATGALANVVAERAVLAPLGASNYRPRPVVDFRGGRALRMDRPAVTKIPRLLVEPYVAPGGLATPN